jgi:FkbH-like protein
MLFLRRAASNRSASAADANNLPMLPAGEAPRSEERVSALDQSASAADIKRLFQAFFQEPIADPNFASAKSRSRPTVLGMVEELVHSPDFFGRLYNAKTMSGGEFRAPRALAEPVLKPKRVLLVGSCASDVFHEQISARESGTQFEKITFNNGSVLPPLTDDAAAEIDFQVMQLPIRAILPEHMYLGGPIMEAQARSWFDVSKSLLQMNFEAAAIYHRQHGLQTFVLNFTTPQQNPLGRLQNPYAYSNPIHYISELNREIYALVQQNRDMYMIDIEQISSGLGKRFIQDDSVSHLNHGSTLSRIDMAGDEARIEPVGDAAGLYSERVADFNGAIYDEVLAAYRSIRQHGAIKLVIFDLDDTLWRGVAAERLDDLDISMTEGWPLGVLEAASFLSKRGILVSIVSKNDEANVVRAWTELYENRFPLETFVGRQINWGSKIENIQRILELVNVGADATLFVDDNPAERARVRDGVPGIRLLNGPVAEWRRQLLWSAELQPPVITEESIGRASTIRGKAVRDEQSRQLSREAFLDQLGLKITSTIVSSRTAPQFSRCLELVNKTNQFNTTGRRWTEVELGRMFEAGGWLLSLSVQDQHAAYGLTAVVICHGTEILQYVMSCRVFGLGVEDTAVALACAGMREDGRGEVLGKILATERNHLSLGLFVRLGFVDQGDGDWRLPAEIAVSVPAHVALVNPAA